MRRAQVIQTWQHCFTWRFRDISSDHRKNIPTSETRKIYSRIREYIYIYILNRKIGPHLHGASEQRRIFLPTTVIDPSTDFVRISTICQRWVVRHISRSLSLLTFAWRWHLFGTYTHWGVVIHKWLSK